jgi:hypothetical protein
MSSRSWKERGSLPLTSLVASADIVLRIECMIRNQRFSLDFHISAMSLRGIEDVNEQPFFGEHTHPLLGHSGQSVRCESILPAVNAFKIDSSY